MKVTPLAIPDVLLVEPRLFADSRGIFFESFSAATFARETGQDSAFIQDNQSVSHKGVVRGLHYQLPPFAQGKLVRVVAGEVFDVAVDIRRSSETFGRWVGEMLSASNRRQLWIPPGFAHGFIALTEGAELFYKVNAQYDRASERSILWNDPALGINWPSSYQPILSDKDEAAPLFAAAELFE